MAQRHCPRRIETCHDDGGDGGDRRSQTVARHSGAAARLTGAASSARLAIRASLSRLIAVPLASRATPGLRDGP